MSLFGLGSTKEKSWIDGETKGYQTGALSQFQQTPQTYTPTNYGLISQYQNPWTNDVVNASMADLEHQRQMAVNTTGDAAQAAGAFGGSRHAVAEGITNGEFARQGGLLSAGLRAQGFNTALDAAQRENALQYQYPLSRQQVYNQTVGGITPMRFGKKQDPGAAMDNFGGLLNTGAQIASFFA